MARTVVLGKSGTGKSWKLGKYLEEVVPEFEYGVHFDIENEERGLCVEGHNGEPPVYRGLYVDREAYEGEFDIPETIARQRKLRIVPDGLTTEEQVDLFGEVCATAMALTKDSDDAFHLSVDEAHNLVPTQNIDDRVSRAITGGRKRGLEWAAATQRAQKLHEDILSQANWGIYFQLTGDRDLGKVAESVDSFDATTVLPGLGTRECVIEDKEAGKWAAVNTDAQERAHPHDADDDGKADEYLATTAADGELHTPGDE